MAGFWAHFICRPLFALGPVVLPMAVDRRSPTGNPALPGDGLLECGFALLDGTSGIPGERCRRYREFAIAIVALMLSRIDDQRLSVRVFHQPFKRVFDADAGLLVATEGDMW